MVRTFVDDETNSIENETLDLAMAAVRFATGAVIEFKFSRDRTHVLDEVDAIRYSDGHSTNIGKSDQMSLANEITCICSGIYRISSNRRTCIYFFYLVWQCASIGGCAFIRRITVCTFRALVLFYA